MRRPYSLRRRLTLGLLLALLAIAGLAIGDSWREANDTLNWRRFFTINELAGLRIEEPEVFEAAHALLFRLYAEGLIDGVRVDHVDGLTDPRRFGAVGNHRHGGTVGDLGVTTPENPGSSPG